jgi:hypothetical protein
VSSVISPTVNSIAMDTRRPVQFMAAVLVALGRHMRMGMGVVCDRIGRRFAEFAGVPYPDPFSRQQWEALWDTEGEAQQQLLMAPPSGGYGRGPLSGSISRRIT